MRYALLIMGILLLAGCATPPVQHVIDGVEWETHQSQVQQLQYWTLNGRLAVNNGAESWHLTLQWVQQGDQYRIHLTGPMGSGHLQLRGDADGVVLDDGESGPRFAEDADDLLYESTGIQVPVSGMRYWIRGLPDPHLNAEQSQLLQGRLSHLVQGGWQLRFLGYQQVLDAQLPRKLFMQRNDLDVRLVIDQWQLGLSNG